MARARNIKPGFFKNEELVEVDYEYRLLFIGLWMLADREGYLEDRPKRIKMEIFPADDVNVDAGLEALDKAGLIRRYTVGEGRYIHVCEFLRHQSPHHREAQSTIPKPGDEPGCNSGESEAEPDAKAASKGGKPKASGASDKSKPEAGPGQASDRAGPGRSDSLNPDSLNPDWGQRQCAGARGNAGELDDSPPSPVVVDPIHSRSIELTALLRHRGASLQASDPRVRQWAESGVTDAQILSALETAQAQRADQGDPKPVNAGYLDSILQASSQRRGKRRGKQAELEARNAAVAASWVPPELRGEPVFSEGGTTYDAE